MPIRNHTGRTPYRLKGSQGQTQTAVAGGGELSWLLNSVAKITDGKLCNYLLGLVVTITGSVTFNTISNGWVDDFANGHIGLRTMHRIVRDIVKSIELRAAWHGTVISAQHVKGSMLELMEFIGNGLERPFRQRKPVGARNNGATPAAPAAESFRVNLWIPLSLLAGRKGHHTAQPVALYDDAEFVVETFPTTVTGDEGGAEITYSNVKFDVSADVLPDAEVRLGPGVQWIDYQQKTSSEAIDVQNLGRVSTMDNTEPGAGVAGLFYLSDREGLPGPVELSTLNRVTFPFRGLVSTSHLDPLLLQLESLASGEENPMVGDPTGSGGTLGAFGSDDLVGFPYAPGDIGAGSGLANPVVLALVCPARDLEVTKVQVSEGTQQLQMQFASQPDGTHHILACQLHSWTPAGFLSAKQKLIDSGVCRAVIGTDDVTWSLKVLNKQNPGLISDRKKRFMAMRLVAADGATPKVL